MNEITQKDIIFQKNMNFKPVDEKFIQSAEDSWKATWEKPGVVVGVQCSRNRPSWT